MNFEKVWDFLVGKKSFFKAAIWGIRCVIANTWKTACAIFIAAGMVGCVGAIYGIVKNFSEEEVDTLTFGFMVFVVYADIVVRSMEKYITPTTPFSDDTGMRWVFSIVPSFAAFGVGWIFVSGEKFGVYASIAAMAGSHILIAMWFKWMFTPEKPPSQKPELQWYELPWIQVSETT